MLGRLKFKIVSFFLELLEFSEDRHRWESVEEKLNAIRYELLVVCFYRSFVHPSFLPDSRRPYLSPSVLAFLSRPRIPPVSVTPFLPPPSFIVSPFLSLLLPSPFFPYLSVLTCPFLSFSPCLPRSLSSSPNKLVHQLHFTRPLCFSLV